MADTRERDPEDQPDDIPPFEWAIAALGLLLVIGCVGYLLHRGLAVDPSPPDIVVRVADVVRGTAGHHVRVEIENLGGLAAADVVVRGVLGDEASDVTIDLLPAGATRIGGLYFRGDPSASALDVRAIGYQEP